MATKRIVIVGGVAAGASAAAKARRTSEDVEIILFEAGPYISFANCGLPYYVGGEIEDRKRLFVTNADSFGKRFNVDVRVNTTVTEIDREQKTVTARPADGSATTIGYDRLILATGTNAIEPPIKGLDSENIFTVRTVPDVDAITERISDVLSAKPETPRAVVIGAGYIGLEMTEQLMRRGFDVTVIEMADQVMLALDAEMAQPVQAALTEAGCEVVLADGVSEIIESNDGTVAITRSGRRFPFDVGILSVGVRPNVELAEKAGIVLGKTGAIQVDQTQRTSDPSIFAAGDNCEARHLVTGKPVNIPLAGPANKTGRIAGANAAMDLHDVNANAPERLRFAGVLGTSICRVFETVAAVTGLTEAAALTEGIDTETAYIMGNNHAGYYPGAEPIMLKVVYSPADGRLLGAQAVGGVGTDKRIDILATAISGGMTVEDLEQLDLCYAPPFASARDIIILAGFAAANSRRGVMPTMTPGQLLDELETGAAPFVVDCRTEKEFAREHLDSAVNIPVDELRERVNEIPTDKPVALHCLSGYRSYVAQRILVGLGRTNVRNVAGGWVLINRTRKSRK